MSVDSTGTHSPPHPPTQPKQNSQSKSQSRKKAKPQVITQSKANKVGVKKKKTELGYSSQGMNEKNVYIKTRCIFSAAVYERKSAQCLLST